MLVEDEIAPMPPPLADLAHAAATPRFLHHVDVGAPLHPAEVAVRQTVRPERREQREVVREARPGLLEFRPHLRCVGAHVSRVVELFLRRGYEGDQLREAVAPLGEHGLDLGGSVPVPRPRHARAVHDCEADCGAKDHRCPLVVEDRLPEDVRAMSDPVRDAEGRHRAEDSPRDGPPEHATLDLQQNAHALSVVIHEHGALGG
mmetsp:Transcript_8296/g.26398  ORF Transcript_8296/g.26398 Transcript_8296/m.26398 type:complete len:203 (-) Transcript_8296:78-686(-)